MKDVFSKLRLLAVVITFSIIMTGCSINIGRMCGKAEFEKVVNLQAPMDAGSKLQVSTSFGGITANGDEVVDCNVIATITVQAPTKEEAAEIGQQVTVQLQASDEGLRIKSTKPKLKNNRSIGISYKITVPKSACLDLNTSYGKVAINNITGDINARSSFGSITCKDTTGNMDLNTSYGSVDCKRIASPKLNAHSSFGSVKASYLKDAPSDIDATLNSSYGSVSLAPPEGFAGNLEMSTSYGSVSTNLPVTVVGKIKKSSLKGTVGQGTGKIVTKSNFGSVSIK